MKNNKETFHLNNSPFQTCPVFPNPINTSHNMCSNCINKITFNVTINTKRLREQKDNDHRDLWNESLTDT